MVGALRRRLLRSLTAVRDHALAMGEQQAAEDLDDLLGTLRATSDCDAFMRAAISTILKARLNDIPLGSLRMMTDYRMRCQCVHAWVLSERPPMEDDLMFPIEV